MSFDFAITRPLLTLTRGLSIRPLLHGDAEKLSEHANNIKIARNMQDTWPHPYTLDSAHSFISLVRDQTKWRAIKSAGELAPLAGNEDSLKAPLHWALCLNGEVIGVTGLMFQGLCRRRVAVLGYWLSEKHWGRGYMTELMRGFVRWAFEAYDDLDRIEATVYSWAPASMVVLRRVGFSEEGSARGAIVRLGKRCDLVTFGMVREGLEIDEEPPS